MNKDELLALADRVEAQPGSDNALDVLCEIALFKPTNLGAAICANDAETKVVITYSDGSQRTFAAQDYTLGPLRRKATAAALRSLAAQEGEDKQ